MSVAISPPFVQLGPGTCRNTVWESIEGARAVLATPSHLLWKPPPSFWTWESVRGWGGRCRGQDQGPPRNCLLQPKQHLVHPGPKSMYISAPVFQRRRGPTERVNRCTFLQQMTSSMSQERREFGSPGHAPGLLTPGACAWSYSHLHLGPRAQNFTKPVKHALLSEYPDRS